METMKQEVASGLEGVVVADTLLSDVDGERGQLIIAGHDVESLAGSVSFEEVCGLLWSGTQPGTGERARLKSALGRAREEAFAWVPELTRVWRLPDGMDALRAALAQLPVRGSEGEEVGARLVGAVAVFAAAWARTQAGLPPVAPDASLGHAEDFLRMVTGERPEPELASGLDAYLVTVSDHGMNASTFAARLVASTGSDSVSCVTAALGALKGPLHGGAPGPVLHMLEAIGSPERAQDWLEAELLAGRRIMGMGHRVYRVRDPRAAVLEKQVERLSRAGRSTGRLQLARAVERAALGVLRTRYPHRPLHANVEFYTAVLLDTLGLPASLFTPTFAVGRASGWYAHIQEQRRTGRLIRPASRYVGERPLPTHS
jgi:citrate synthase